VKNEFDDTVYVEWAADHFGLCLPYIDLFLTNLRTKNDFYNFVPSDLDLCPLDLKFVLVVTLVLVQHYVSTN